MQAITVWEPRASLIAIGAKPYEFRKWAARKGLIGQRIAIHAGARPVRPAEVRALLISLRGKTPGRNGLKAAIAEPYLDRLSLNPKAAPLSHIVCTAVLGQPVRADAVMSEFGVEVENDSDRDYAFNFAWPMLQVEPCLPPIPAKGAQGFWTWSA